MSIGGYGLRRGPRCECHPFSVVSQGGAVSGIRGSSISSANGVIKRPVGAIGGAGAKFAATLVAAVTATTHVPVPVHPPPVQPVKTDPLAALAVSVTLVPLV